MKQFIIKDYSGNVVGVYETKEEASQVIIDAVNNEDVETIFDLKCEEKEIDVYPMSFGDACKFLGIPESAIALKGDNAIAKSAVAFYKLAIIAKAWNKIDGFVPDFSNADQYKYFPRFVYKTRYAGFVSAYTEYMPGLADAYASFGSRLCFKSSATARKFGIAFTELYNEMFLDSLKGNSGYQK